MSDQQLPAISSTSWVSGFRILKSWILLVYLFTKSDIKTVLVPVTIYSAIIAPLSIYQRLFVSVLWTWLHLLFFCMSNQCFGVLEDTLNKPWRPIPSNRITQSQTTYLRWILAIVCIALSIHYDASWASFTLLIATWIYNDLGLHGHWMGKNILNAIGYVAFEAGATMISGNHYQLPTQSRRSLVCVGLVILTTIHAGDFPDIVGDRKLGRTTLPIAFPKATRIILGGTLALWSFAGCIWSWTHSSTISILALSGVLVGGRYLLFRDVREDKISCLLYHAWLSWMHIVFAVIFCVRST